MAVRHAAVRGRAKYVGEVLRVDQMNPDAGAIACVADVLRIGGVAIFPTETVYGIAVCVEAAVDTDKLFTIKRRPHDCAIPWLVADAGALDVYGVDVPEYAHRLAEAYWPGALTLVVKASDVVPRAFCADDGSIALRAPDNSIVQALLHATGAPLATTSANIHGCPAPGSFEQLDPALMDAADIVLDGGATAVGAASSIVICTGVEPVFGRNSAIPVEELQCFLASNGTRDIVAKAYLD